MELFNKILFDVSNVLFQRACQLVGARGGLEAAFYAAQTFDDLIGFHSDCKGRNTLRISGATSDKLNAGNHVILNINYYLARTSSFCSICNLSGHYYKILSLCNVIV